MGAANSFQHVQPASGLTIPKRGCSAKYRNPVSMKGSFVMRIMNSIFRSKNGANVEMVRKLLSCRLSFFQRRCHSNMSITAKSRITVHSGIKYQ